MILLFREVCSNFGVLGPRAGHGGATGGPRAGHRGATGGPRAGHRGATGGPRGSHGKFRGQRVLDPEILGQRTADLKIAEAAGIFGVRGWGHGRSTGNLGGQRVGPREFFGVHGWGHGKFLGSTGGSTEFSFSQRVGPPGATGGPRDYENT